MRPWCSTTPDSPDAHHVVGAEPAPAGVVGEEVLGGGLRILPVPERQQVVVHHHAPGFAVGNRLVGVGVDDRDLRPGLDRADRDRSAVVLVLGRDHVAAHAAGLGGREAGGELDVGTEQAARPCDVDAVHGVAADLYRAYCRHHRRVRHVEQRAQQRGHEAERRDRVLVDPLGEPALPPHTWVVGEQRGAAHHGGEDPREGGAEAERRN